MNSSLINAFDIIPVGIVIFDENMLIKYINKTALSLIGQEYRETVGTYFGDSFKCVERYSYENGCGYGPFCKDCEIRNAVSSAFDGQSTDRMEANISLLINGLEKNFWFYISAAHFVSEDKSNVILTLEDITEKKKKEIMEFKYELDNIKGKWERYYKLAEITNSIILFVDMYGNIFSI